MVVVVVRLLFFYIYIYYRVVRLHGYGLRNLCFFFFCISEGKTRFGERGWVGGWVGG